LKVFLDLNFFIKMQCNKVQRASARLAINLNNSYWTGREEVMKK